MPRTASNTVEAPAVEAPTPAPVYQVIPDDPERLKIIQTLALMSAALARVDSGLMKWAGGNTQFEATRFTLTGQRTALVAVIAALEGDPQALKDL